MRKLVVGLAAVALAVPAVTTLTAGREGPLGAPAAALGAGDPLDRALGDDLSLLALLPADVGEGRFAFEGGLPVRPEITGNRWRGVFWRTASGNVYLRAQPYDEDLVRREVRALADRLGRLSRDDWDPATFAPMSTGSFYDGSEFQLRLSDAVAALVGGDGVGLRYFSADGGCAPAVDRHDEAVRAAVRGLRPAFRPFQGQERWRIDLTPLRAATRATRNAAEVECQRGSREPEGRSADDEGPPYVEVVRSARLLLLRVPTEDRLDAWRDLITVRVTPGDVGAPPDRPRPHFGAHPVVEFAVVGFLLAVSDCRALPWEHSDFMASDIYTSPAAGGYLGPTPFSNKWVCERDVPPDERAKQDR